MRTKSYLKKIALLLALTMLLSICSVLPAFAASMTTAVFFVDAENTAVGGKSGTYTIEDAIVNVKDGGTIKMVGNAVSTSRATPSVSKSYTIDGAKAGGGVYQWTHSVTNNSAIRFSGTGETVTVTNVAFHTTTRCQVLQVADNNTVTLKLGKGVTFTAAKGATYVNAVIMAGNASTIVLDGAEFLLDGPAMTVWGNGTHNFELNKGTLSYGANDSESAAISCGYDATNAQTNITINGNVKVYSGNASALGDLSGQHISAALTKKNYTIGDNCDLPFNDFDITDYVAISNEKNSMYKSLQEAIDAAASGSILNVYGRIQLTTPVSVQNKSLTFRGMTDGAIIASSNSNVAMLVLHNAAVTIEDLTWSGTLPSKSVVEFGGLNDSAYQWSTLILNDGASIVNGASVGGNTGGNGVSIFASGINTVVVNEGATISTGGTAVKADNYPLDFTMNGGVITSQNRGLIVNSNSEDDVHTITINGGTITAATDPVAANASALSVWTIHTYYSYAAILTINGGTIQNMLQGQPIIAGNNTTPLYRGGTLKVGGTVVFSAPTFSNNYMHVYTPDSNVSVENSGFAFASKLNSTPLNAMGNRLISVTYGMLICPSELIGEGIPLTVLSNKVLNIPLNLDQITPNGYLYTAAVNLSDRALRTPMVACAYATVTFEMNGETVTLTSYGKEMRASGAAFANAYLILGGYDSAAEIEDEGTREVISYYATKEGDEYFMDLIENAINATPAKTYINAAGSELYSYPNISINAYFNTCYCLSGNGYTLYSGSINQYMDKNMAATYYNAELNEMIHVYWLANENSTTMGELNIVYAYTANLPDPETQVSTGKSGGKISVTQMQPEGGNGMGYVVQLEDGSFVIVDGGYGGYDANDWDDPEDRLYQLLKKLNGNSEKNIVIRAWILTHPHDDHYGAFDAFAPQYGSKVTLERIVYSPASVSHSWSQYFLNGVFTAAANFEGVKFLSVHTGMRLTFGGLTMEMLYTADDLYIDGISDDENNTSMVFRLLDADGYSMIFLADAGDDACNHMLKNFPTLVESDMGTVSHHGYEDAPISVYEAIFGEDGAVDYLWYPANNSLYDVREFTEPLDPATTGYMWYRNAEVLTWLEEHTTEENRLISGTYFYNRTWGASGVLSKWVIKGLLGLVWWA